MKEILMKELQHDIQEEKLDVQNQTCNEENRKGEPVKVGDAVKSLYEQMGGEYVQVGDYRLPTLISEAQPSQHPIGRYGRLRERFLRENRPHDWLELKLNGRLDFMLGEIDYQANCIKRDLTRKFATKEGITEELKAKDQMAWVRKMNNIQNRIDEIILHDLIYV
jgi:hypothetical protein